MASTSSATSVTPGKVSRLRHTWPPRSCISRPQASDVVEAVADGPVVRAEDRVVEGDGADPHAVEAGVDQPLEHVRLAAVGVDVDGGARGAGSRMRRGGLDQRVVAGQRLALAPLAEGDDGGVVALQVPVGERDELVGGGRESASAPAAPAPRRRSAARCSRGSRRCTPARPAARPRSGGGRCSARCSTGSPARSGRGGRRGGCPAARRGPPPPRRAGRRARTAAAATTRSCRCAAPRTSGRRRARPRPCSRRAAAGARPARVWWPGAACAGGRPGRTAATASHSPSTSTGPPSLSTASGRRPGRWVSVASSGSGSRSSTVSGTRRLAVAAGGAVAVEDLDGAVRGRRR